MEIVFFNFTKMKFFERYFCFFLELLKMKYFPVFKVFRFLFKIGFYGNEVLQQRKTYIKNQNLDFKIQFKLTFPLKIITNCIKIHVIKNVFLFFLSNEWIKKVNCNKSSISSNNIPVKEVIENKVNRLPNLLIHTAWEITAIFNWNDFRF